MQITDAWMFDPKLVNVTRVSLIDNTHFGRRLTLVGLRVENLVGGRAQRLIPVQQLVRSGCIHGIEIDGHL